MVGQRPTLPAREGLKLSKFVVTTSVIIDYQE